jgi:uncharacterized membrane protein YbhN (UPF0104 family)
MTGLDNRMLDERDTIRTVLGKKWWQAVLLTTGRLGFDFGCLLCVLRATGGSPAALPRTAGLLRHRHHRAPPVHSGGLGIVEASLSGLLILAGVHPGDAVLATLAYRVASDWLPLLAVPSAYLLFRHRYGTQASHPPDHQGIDADSEHHPRADGTTD